MKIRDDFRTQRVKNAQKYFSEAESKLDSALTYQQENEDIDYANKFFNLQRCIEKSSKSLFKLMDVKHPNKHKIEPNSQEGMNLLNAIKHEVENIDYSLKNINYDKKFIVNMHVNEVSRIMFLTKMYGDVYPISEYGINNSNIDVRSSDIITHVEYSNILDNALSSLRISDAIIDSIATGEIPSVKNKKYNFMGEMECRSSVSIDYYGVSKKFHDNSPVNDYRKKYNSFFNFKVLNQFL